jgi:hypothetical protein
LLSTGSANVITWYSASLANAEDYDLTNVNYFKYSVPGFIVDDPHNDNYITFLNMMGQFFDNIWVYITSITDINLANNNLNAGISKDVVYSLLQSLGVSIFNSFGDQNIANYLSNYRMMNDYISIFSAEVIDLSMDISIVLDSAQNSGQVISSVVDKLSAYFNPQTRQLGQNVYLSEVRSLIQNTNGVLTVANIDVFNEVGGQYSSAETSMVYANEETKLILPVDDTIFAQPSQVYQIRYPNKDIRVSVKNFQSVTFS